MSRPATRSLAGTAGAASRLARPAVDHWAHRRRKPAFDNELPDPWQLAILHFASR